MSKALRWVVSVAVMTLIVPSVASAENFYAAIRGGPGITSDSKAGPPGGEDTLEFKTGFTGGAAVGYGFPFGLRVEGELGFLWDRVKKDGGVDIDGSIKNYMLMANAYYDIKIPALGPFRPYVGGGIGAARVNDDREVFADRLGVKFDLNEWRTAFAYQARAGVIYDVNKWLDLSAGYRYVHIDGGHYEVGPTKFRIDAGDQNNHSIELGFAVKF
jgi:opacity protein-like surface antigen